MRFRIRIIYVVWYDFYFHFWESLMTSFWKKILFWRFLRNWFFQLRVELLTIGWFMGFNFSQTISILFLEQFMFFFKKVLNKTFNFSCLYKIHAFFKFNLFCKKICSWQFIQHIFWNDGQSHSIFVIIFQYFAFFLFSFFFIFKMSFYA